MIGADRDPFCRVRTGARSAPNDLDATVVDNVCRQRRQAGAISDAQDLAMFQAPDIIFGYYILC